MKEIYVTDNFKVEVPEKPHVPRDGGGHLIITPIVPVVDRTGLSPALAIELMRLTMVVGEAMATALNKNSVDVGRINYQDNGNWSVTKPGGAKLHVHLFGRARSAKIQKWGEACHLPLPTTGFYNGFEPLTEKDRTDIRAEIERIFACDTYQDANWHL